MFKRRFKRTFVFILLNNLFKSNSRLFNIDFVLEFVVIRKHSSMLESYSSAFLIFINIRSHSNLLVCNEILRPVFVLVHVEEKLRSFVFIVRRNIKVDWTFWKYHHIFTIHILEICLNWEFSLVKLLLT